jgi:hypothetical protein
MQTPTNDLRILSIQPVSANNSLYFLHSFLKKLFYARLWKEMANKDNTNAV